MTLRKLLKLNGTPESHPTARDKYRNNGPLAKNIKFKYVFQ